jgi:hypothetical protein
MLPPDESAAIRRSRQVRDERAIRDLDRPGARVARGRRQREEDALLRLVEPRIAAVTAFVDGEIVRRFGLPNEIRA